MNKEYYKEYIEHKELGVTILTAVYLGLIIVIYLGIILYISNVDSSKESIYQSIVPLIITGVIGGFSKGLYFSLVDLIFNNKKEDITEKVKRNNQKVEGIVNYITILLLLRFLGSMNTSDNTFLTVTMIAVTSLSFLIFIAMYFKFTFVKAEEIREKIDRREEKKNKKERKRKYKESKKRKSK